MPKRVMPNTADTHERFTSKVHCRASDECWPWMGRVDGCGYGVAWYDGKDQRSHRVMWQITHGLIPLGMCVCHVCDNPPCCNPRHLFLGTRTDNMRDMSRKGRASGQQKTHCKNGHPFDATNTGKQAGGKRMCRKCSVNKTMRYLARNGKLSDAITSKWIARKF